MKSNPIVKNLLLTLFGIVFLLLGVTLVLREWDSLIIVFKGVVGGTLAVAGLFMLFLASGKSSKD
ncbi:MAG: hypothetical protein JNN05_11855 [Candidatus Omnitrophica bacterium]|nr:hypothetical protein [Candidatus Omnitrophota bacterium]